LDDLVSKQLQQDLLPQDAEPRDGDVPTDDALPAYGETFQALAQDGLTQEVQALSGIVLDKLNGKRPVPLKGLENEYQKVYQLIEQTVTVGEGNSMLLLGSRGCGKTAIVESVLSSLARTHRDDFHVVRLNGFLHTDDRLALRETWRQLGRETNTEEEAGKVTNYADTMSTLLALLSHPEELFGAPSHPGAITAAKSVVIILDEFDLFVTHPRQTLLYNLFDIAQARKAPVAVLGLTTKVDVTEMLEKRVKSRFSHRYVFVPLPRTFDTFSEICHAGLNLDDDELTGLMEDADLGVRATVKSEGWNRLVRGWRAYLQVRSPITVTRPTWTDLATGSLDRRCIPVPPPPDIQPDEIGQGILHERADCADGVPLQRLR
jgi:origin recognition complex subunit 4